MSLQSVKLILILAVIILFVGHSLTVPGDNSSNDSMTPSIALVEPKSDSVTNNPPTSITDLNRRVNTAAGAPSVKSLPNDVSYWELSVWYIKSYEACFLYPYKCSGGKWTIGFGHLIKEDEFGTALTGGMTKQKLDLLWTATIGQTHLEKVKNFGNQFMGRATVDRQWAHVTFTNDIKYYKDKASTYTDVPHQQWALTMFAYNVGWGNIHKGHRTSKALTARDWDSFADAMLLYNKANGKVLRGLVKRRSFESKLMRGVLPTFSEIETIRQMNSEWWQDV